MNLRNARHRPSPRQEYFSPLTSRITLDVHALSPSSIHGTGSQPNGRALAAAGDQPHLRVGEVLQIAAGRLVVDAQQGGELLAPEGPVQAEDQDDHHRRHAQQHGFHKPDAVELVSGRMFGLRSQAQLLVKRQIRMRIQIF